MSITRPMLKPIINAKYFEQNRNYTIKTKQEETSCYVHIWIVSAFGERFNLYFTNIISGVSRI